MENASKALLMAGGMLLAILLLTLLIYAWSLFSEYQSSRDDLADIENTAKFNQQFTNYDREDVQGYELITLVNQIVDYNERKTQDTQNNNNVKYNPIKITIDMVNPTLRKKLAYSNESNELILLDKYEDGDDSSYFTATARSNAKSSFENNILNKLTSALTLPNGTTLNEATANKVAKNIGSIFHKSEEITALANNRSYYGKNVYNVYLDMANTYIASTGEENYLTPGARIAFAQSNLVIDNGNNNKYYNYACIYYEYMQFKRGVFECTNLEYDSVTGRVIKIDFIFTGKIH